MRTSDDDGQTWSKTTHLFPWDKPGDRVLNNDRVVQLNRGRLVVPVATHYQRASERCRSLVEECSEIPARPVFDL